jgi:membrane protease YdiL (CAAX protease family)
MQERKITKKNIIISVLLVLGGGAVFVLGNPYYSVFPTNGNQIYIFSLTVIFLVISVILKRNQSLSRYWPAAYSLFVATTGLFSLSTGILNMQNRAMPPVQYIAVDKLSQALHIVPVVIGLTLIAKNDLKAIFICRGRLKRGLTFGLVSFGIFAVAGLAIFLKSPDVLPSLPEAIPWMLLWVFSNAIMEELWFWGIFLRNYNKIIGRKAAILVTSIIFGVSHINATYEIPGGGLVFGLVVFGLGIIGAYAMVKDDSLIGPVLFHAGYDLLIVIPVLMTV